MSHQNFSQRTHPIHPFGPLPHVLVHFVLFGCIWDSLVALQNSMQNGPKWCKSSCHEVVSELFANNAPDPPYWTLTQNSCFIVFYTIFVQFGTVRLRYKTQCKKGQIDAKVRATKSRRKFSQRTQPIHRIGL